MRGPENTVCKKKSGCRKKCRVFRKHYDIQGLRKSKMRKRERVDKMGFLYKGPRLKFHWSLVTINHVCSGKSSKGFAAGAWQSFLL